MRDEERQARLTTRDQGYSVAAYAKRGKSALYATEQSSKPLDLMEAIRFAALRYNGAAKIWLDRLAQVSTDEVGAVFQQLPSGRITDASSEFAQRLLEFNRQRLLTLRKEL